MQYMMAIYETETPSGEKPEIDWGAWMAYTEALQRAGVMVGGNGLQESRTATTLRLRDGRRQVQDGPYADTKEQLAGYYVLEVDSLDQALDWAARCPAASTGTLELRPVLAMS
ncbi:MAG TPA: YciI family protein [Alphaproteobacteria bacterium]|nr:YciI family protein [Alphaproteobacteria bacterium]